MLICISLTMLGLTKLWILPSQIIFFHVTAVKATCQPPLFHLTSVFSDDMKYLLVEQIQPIGMLIFKFVDVSKK